MTGNSPDYAETQDTELKMVTKDRELRDIIHKDLDRTMQDIEFFTSQEIKNKMYDVLYLWSKDNPDYGYRQGMNEILGVLTLGIFQEVVKHQESDDLINVVFDEKYAFADIYWLFERLMSLGVRCLY